MMAWNWQCVLLASCSEDKTAMVWSPKSEAPIHIFKDHSDSINQIKWNHTAPAGSKGLSVATTPIIATASKDKTVKLWDVEQGKCIRTLQQH